MNEDYISYELAKKLKECGFDEPCDKWIASKSFSYYDEEECCDHNAVIRKGWLISQKQKERYDQEALPYLSLWHAQKWLREGAMLHVGAYPAVPTRKWHFYIDDLNQHVNPHDGELITRWDEDMQEKADERLYDSYECALSAGIYTALELIKKGG